VIARKRSAPAILRPLSDVIPFADTRNECFKDLGRGAMPPWFWRGGGAPEGAIIRSPGALYRAMRMEASRRR
jgi:hypothetical protein